MKMAKQKPSAWTPAVRLLGNVIPGICCIPFLVAGVLHFRPEKPLEGWPIWFLGFVVVGWLSLATFGFWGNQDLKDAIGRKLNRSQPPSGEPVPRWFVGMARPSYHSILDPHEDVGFLTIHVDELEFFGDELKLKLPWSTFNQVVKRANPHTLLGLGGWISLEGEGPDGNPIRLLIEPREHSFLPRNRGVRQRLLKELRAKVVDSPHA